MNMKTPKTLFIILSCLVQSFSYVLNPCAFTAKPVICKGRIAPKLKKICCFSHFINEEEVFDADMTCHDERVQVFDNVFSSFACDELRYLAENHSSRGNDGSSMFTRPPLNDTPLTPIEHAIDSFLSSIGDTTSLVEYWSRDEYINIDTHADIDEVKLLDENVIRCPQMGHVLYLQVEEDVRGPTCVFTNKRKGWKSSNGIENNVELVVTPAINGRILRFPGNAMHAVPCPAHRWFLSIDKQEHLSNQEAIEEDKGVEFYDDDCYDDAYRERSVLLFNTWSEAGPKAVNGDYINGSLPEGIELSQEDAKLFLQTEEARIMSEWEEEYGTNAEKVRCNEPIDWLKVDLMIVEKELVHKDQSVLLIGLMGNESRRLNTEKFIKLLGPSNALKEALAHKHQPTALTLLE